MDKKELHKELWIARKDAIVGWSILSIFLLVNGIGCIAVDIQNKTVSGMTWLNGVILVAWATIIVFRFGAFFEQWKQYGESRNADD